MCSKPRNGLTDDVHLYRHLLACGTQTRVQLFLTRATERRWDIDPAATGGFWTLELKLLPGARLYHHDEAEFDQDLARFHLVDPCQDRGSCKRTAIHFDGLVLLPYGIVRNSFRV